MYPNHTCQSVWWHMSATYLESLRARALAWPSLIDRESRRLNILFRLSWNYNCVICFLLRLLCNCGIQLSLALSCNFVIIILLKFSCYCNCVISFIIRLSCNWNLNIGILLRIHCKCKCVILIIFFVFPTAAILLTLNSDCPATVTV